ncbi:YfcC family protein [Synergistes jonesii]|uniref:YfcC family protein n=1 Tax=Synergistes jonesii TaxID=2754 RepID=UPI00243079FE|nr:YfcC family protein [Synergistes jonesii]
MENTAEKKMKLKALNPIVLLAIILVIAAIATYVVPAGLYERVADPATQREVVNPQSFKYVAQHPIGFFEFFMSITLGMQKAAYIIFFLFLVGGAFGVIEATGAMNACLASVVKKMGGRELILIPVCMIIFGCGSAFAGNFEEYLVFVPLMIAVCVAIGFDSLTAIGVVFCAAASGYAGAMTNPFTVGVAQGISGLPMFSGIVFRAGVFIALITASIIYVTLYARRIKRNPEISAVHEIDLEHNSHMHTAIAEAQSRGMTTRHKLVLLTFVAAIAVLVYGVLKLGFYIDELAALFVIVGIVAGIAGGLKPGEIADSFLKGCDNMLFACMVIGLCNAVIIITENASIMDTVIHSLSMMLNGLPPAVSACAMFIVQDIFNVLVPSGSGQAAITMPIMAPLADVIGVTRQTAVLAFQMGDSFTNVLAPTSGEVIAALAMAKIPYGKWVKWLLPLFGIWCLIAFVSLIVAVTVGYGPF